MACTLTPASCAAAWDREASTDDRLAFMIEQASEWLSHCVPSKAINRTTPSSLGLSKIAGRWHGGARILNGCFLMAAHRAGYQMEPQPPRFVAKLGRGDANAWISILQLAAR